MTRPTPAPLPSRLFVAIIFAAASIAVSAMIAALPTAAIANHAPVKTKRGGDEMFALGFEQLSAFDFTIVDSGTGASPEQIAEAQKRDQVPDWVHFYEGKRVVLTGYMMPLQSEHGRWTKFIMMKDVTTCCYGAVPAMNDYVVVTMKGEGVAAVQDVPSELIGVFHVAPKYENGYIASLFTMDGEKFLGARK